MRHKDKQKGKVRVPGIKKIWSLDGDTLQPSIMYQSMIGMVIAINIDLFQVDFSGEPSLEIESSVINGGFFESSSLNFFCPAQKPRMFRHTCWIVETVSGEKLLIGNKESRWPLTSAKETVGSTQQGAGTAFTVSHKARSSVALVVM